LAVGAAVHREQPGGELDQHRGLAAVGALVGDGVGLRTGPPAQRLALAAGRRLDDASPYVDALLPGSGVRLHAVLAPTAADGTYLVWEKRWDQVLDWTGAPFAKCSWAAS
jgi:hypothetical protein